MYAQFIKFLEDLRASYWFIPTCMALGALVLSFIMHWLDARYGAEWLRDFEWLTATRTEGARAILTVIAGSIIGVAGVTFSITIVAVSYASANFGPRLIGNFMRDRGNQATLGTFIATFVYCLMVLRTVRNASAAEGSQTFDAFVPHLSILMALSLALASISVLIFFIHHVPETINVGNIAAKIGIDLRKRIFDLFPDYDELAASEKNKAAAWNTIEELTHSRVSADGAGYVQALDESRLAELAANNDYLIRVQYRPGDFVIVKNTILDVWAANELDGDSIADLQACYAIGQHRTAHQNILFLVDELIEIIARALSPGINDPFTAITCFNWLKVALTYFAEREPNVAPPALRVQLYPISFERFAAAIFDQSRQYVSSDRNTALHVVTIITEVAAQTQSDKKRAILREHLDKLIAACRDNLRENEGGSEVAARYDEALELLSTPDGYEKYRNSSDWFGGRA